MPTPQESLVVCFNPVPFAAAPGAEAMIGWLATASGNAMLVAIAGAPIVISINLDLADDEVAIGGPDSAGVRRLFQGRVDGANNIQESVPVLTGAQTLTLGKAEDTPHVSGDVGVFMLAVLQSAMGPMGAPGDYVGLTVDDFNRLYIADKGQSTPAIAVVAVAAASVLLIASSTTRRAVTIQNRGPGPLYIAPGTPATTAHFLLANGESKTFRDTPVSLWNGISNAAGASAVIITEAN
jgi:hypothetical protein